MKKIEQEKNRPASNIPYQGVNKPFRTLFIVPGPGVTIEQDANGVCYISAEGGAGVADLVAGDNIVLNKTEDGKIVISAVDTATEIAAGQHITIDIDPETGTAVINAITGGATDEHYQGVFDTVENLIAFDTDPEIGDYGMIKQITYSDGGEITWNGQYKYCFYINGQWTVVDQMLTFTDDIELLKQFYSVGGSSPVIYLHKIAQTGRFGDLRDVPIVATPEVTVEGTTVTATCATEGAEIWYSIDGSMPHVNGNKYTGPITVTEPTTFRFVGIKNGMINSLEATIGVDYELQPPTIDLDWHDGTITMANPNQSGTIYYTTDGNTPTNASNAYTGPFIIDEDTLFKLVVIDGNNQSSVTEQQYMQANPVTNFASSTNWPFGRTSIIFSNSEEGEAHYEMYGSIPTYNSPLSQGSLVFPYYDLELNPRYYSVRVFKEGKVPSVITKSPQHGKQKPTAPGISFDPETGLVTINRLSETLSISYKESLATNGCTIRYTIDGSTPTADSLVYTEPFQISDNVTVKAVLIAYGQYYSDVASRTIVITDGPSFSLDHLEGVVTMQGPSGSTIYYTIDGSEPTTSSNVYSAPVKLIPLSSSDTAITVKAIAVVDGQESGVSSVTYPILKWKDFRASYSYNTLANMINVNTPPVPADGASMLYRAYNMQGYTSDWQPWKGDGSLPYMSAASPMDFEFKQVKPNCIPTIAGGSLKGVATPPDAPVIAFDEDTQTATLTLGANTTQIPLQTNNNTPELGARIYYTLDGSTPTAQNGTLYQGSAFSIPSGTTSIKAVTVCYGEFVSEVAAEEIGPAPVSVDYLQLTAQEAGSTVSMVSTLETAPDLEYSTDGETWQEWQHITADGTHTFDTLTLAAVGDRVFFRGDNPEGFGFIPEGEGMFQFSHFELTGKIAAGGNIMSIIDKNAETTVIPAFGFILMFGGLTVENQNTSLTTAAAMPSVTAIEMGGCAYMYSNCTSLTAATAMPSVTAIEESGCVYMYAGDTSLTAATAMPSVIAIGEGGCSYMYSNCTSLTAAAAMPALTSIGEAGCWEMYSHCTSLTSAAAMPSVTTIGNRGCAYMYASDTSLTSAAEMPALTTIGEEGCLDMYYGDTSLTFAADMPALTSIGKSGCWEMYSHCTSLTSAAAMPSVTTIEEGGCTYMYSNCTFNMSDDGTTLNFAFPTPPVTAGEETFSTAYDVAVWMGNTNGF